MQDNPLLQKLDWVFTSSSWTVQYPNTSVLPLSRPISAHIPCVIKIETEIPSSKKNRFENSWLQLSDIIQAVELHWNSTAFFTNSTKTLAAKYKQVRLGLKQRSKQISNLNKCINNCSFG